MAHCSSAARTSPNACGPTSTQPPAPASQRRYPRDAADHSATVAVKPGSTSARSMASWSNRAREVTPPAKRSTDPLVGVDQEGDGDAVVDVPQAPPHQAG